MVPEWPVASAVATSGMASFCEDTSSGVPRGLWGEETGAEWGKRAVAMENSDDAQTVAH